jgi:hypothetical protein
MWYVIKTDPFQFLVCLLKFTFVQADSEQGRIQGALYSIQAAAAGVGPMMMRYVDHLAKDTSLGPGTMFIFAAFLQLFALYFSCKLPKDKSNSKMYDSDVDLSDKSSDEIVELQ